MANSNNVNHLSGKLSNHFAYNVDADGKSKMGQNKLSSLQ
jgi:hypothetical protein